MNHSPRRPSESTTSLDVPPLGGASNPFSRPAPFAGNPTGFEQGTVLSVDANTHMYRVRLATGRVQYMARIRAHPGDLALLPVHTTVMVTYGLGLPYICGIIPDVGRPSEQTETSSEGLTGTSGHGGEDPLLSRTVTSSARGADEPRDQLPGDSAIRSPDGASVAALAGRVAQLKGSDVAKIEAFGTSDLVRIVAGLLQTVTWMGESRVVNQEGRVSFLWDGGSDQLTQTGQDENAYTIHLRLGYDGNLARFKITNREGQPKFEVQVNPNGGVRIFSSDQLRAHYGSSGEDHHQVGYVGSVSNEITGDRSEEVGGDAHLTVDGARTDTVTHDDTCYVGGAHFCQVTADSRWSIGGNFEAVVTGTHSTFCNGNMALEVLGSGFCDVKTTGGQIRLTTRGGNFEVQAGSGEALIRAQQIKLQAGANAIKLGNTPTSHATKFEELQTALTALAGQLTTLHGLLATHIHPLAGPAGNTAPSPVLGPLSNGVQVNISGAQSTTTLVE